MSEKRLRQIEGRIERIKAELVELPPVLRPGSLTRQYANPSEKKGAYWQVSHTLRMRSQTEYVKPVCVSQVRNQIAAYKKFKKLMEEWVELGLEASRIMMKGEEGVRVGEKSVLSSNKGGERIVSGETCT